MPIKSFSVGPKKALVLAQCAAVPPVMVIAGPNGAGKSTMLFDLYQRQGTVETTPDCRIIYQNPHRAIRRTSINRRFILGGHRNYLETLTQVNMGGLEGLQFPYPSRAPDNVDESGSTIKYSLGAMENKRQTFQSRVVDEAVAAKSSTIPTDTFSDPYEPLRELTKYLLPHLTFKKVDFSEESNIRCVWTRRDSVAESELDLDDLSSGEKSVVTLFLPLLESRINHSIAQMGLARDKRTLPDVEDICFIIDEPELHLHPDLQAKILMYMRRLSSEGIQFIIATHSPTLLDQAYDTELYVLNSPVEGEARNQLQRVATNIERLEALRALTGTTFVVTTGRSIVCTEGVPAGETAPADVQLLNVLYPRASAYTLVPCGGKHQVIQTVERLREFLPTELFNVRVFGLVDADQDAQPLPDGVERLPVTMIENLLLDAASIHTYMGERGITTLLTVADVTNELVALALSERAAEIALRVGKRLGMHTVRLKGATIEEVKRAHTSDLGRAQALLPNDATVSSIIQEAERDVDSILAARKSLTLFRGKSILKAFYNNHIQSTNESFGRFCYELAERVAAQEKLLAPLDEVFDRLN